jgi:hypothetical protein
LVHEAGIGAVGEGHLVGEDRGVGALPGARRGLIRSRPPWVRTARTLRSTSDGQR